VAMNSIDGHQWREREGETGGERNGHGGFGVGVECRTLGSRCNTHFVIC
jgi:hypothetical protein